MFFWSSLSLRDIRMVKKGGFGSSLFDIPRPWSEGPCTFVELDTSGSVANLEEPLANDRRAYAFKDSRLFAFFWSDSLGRPWMRCSGAFTMRWTDEVPAKGTHPSQARSQIIAIQLPPKSSGQGCQRLKRDGWRFGPVTSQGPAQGGHRTAATSEPRWNQACERRSRFGILRMLLLFLHF